MKDIPGYESIYAATTDGNIFSYKADKFLKKLRKTDGYHQVSLTKSGKSSFFLVHRLIAITFLSNKEDKKCVNHKDSNRENNSIDNLEWVTHKENAQHMVMVGRALMGEQNPASKLIQNDIRYIRAENAKGKSCRALAKEYGLAYSTTTRIVNRVTWNWVD